MSDFNAGLRIEVENDLFREDGEEVVDDIEVDKDQTEGRHPSPASYAEDSDKEDGELSGPNSPRGGDDAMAMEVDGVDEGTDDGESTKFSADGSHDSEARMPRTSADEKVYRPRTYPNPFLDDVLVSEEKLNSRAARFGISTTTPGNVPARVQLPLPSDKEVLDLYVLLGLIEDDGGEPTLDKVGNQYRLNSILIRGTNQMSTKDIFAYLRDNNQRPLNMEWVNDACCVVNYKDKYEAARSLLSVTKPITIEPRPERKETDEGGLEPEDEMLQDLDFHAADTVSSRYVTVAMPPGHTWRFAAPCPQARGILMRYATTQDKKQEKSERHSEYYKKFGNPNYQGLGIVTSSFRNRLQKKKSKELPEEPEAVPEKQPVSNRLAWAQLSQRWNDEELAAAQQRAKGIKPKPNNGGQRDQSGPFHGPRRPRNESPNTGGFPKKNLKVQVEFEDRGAGIKSRLKRRREPTEGDEEGEEEEHSSESDDEETKWSKKLKGPRMRMHADEEEQRMKSRIRRQGQGGNRGGRGGNVHSRLSNRLSWPGVYRRKDEGDL